MPQPNPNADATIPYENVWVKTFSADIQAVSSATIGNATGPEMTVRFQSDGSGTKSGFTASFACVGAATLSDSRAARTRYNDAAASLSFGSYERYDGVDCAAKGAILSLVEHF